ncbi:MAG: nuclear transport factor 2 family protein [Blastocatellia bacterium]
MSRKLENARNLYLHGIRDGNAREAVTKYTGERYTQHSAGVKDGIEGFVEFFEPFLARNPVRDIQVIRSIEHGQYVFVHVFQSLNHGESRWVTMDMFDTDKNDRIIEHWDVIAEYVDDTASGHSMISGPTEIVDLEATLNNKNVVTEFLVEVLGKGNLETITNYVSTDTYIQHSPKVADGIAGTVAFLRAQAESGSPLRYDEVFKVIGQGNLVAGLSKASIGEKSMAVFDAFSPFLKFVGDGNAGSST